MGVDVLNKEKSFSRIFGVDFDCGVLRADGDKLGFSSSLAKSEHEPSRSV
jgi:hypothetical protein